jgi:hypothetical protein
MQWLILAVAYLLLTFPLGSLIGQRLREIAPN